MCGIAGIAHSGLDPDELRERLAAMNASQLHRGPDEGGLSVIGVRGSGLASRRLSIVDIEHGSQPLSNEDGAIHVVLNGEIYNHVPLREKLAQRGHRFRTRCDTEVVVHLYEEYGDDCLSHLHGMFGLAIYDIPNEKLLLARDGAGMKPVYYAETGQGLVFASEVNALFASGLVSPRPDLESLDIYLSFGMLPAPYSGFSGIRKLAAGQYVVADSAGVRAGVHWEYHTVNGARRGGDEEYAGDMEEQLRLAVRAHLAADVPVGAFLSGGWDSSLVTAMAAREVGPKLKTFSVIFPDSPSMDESRYSRLMAKHLGTEHYEIEFTGAQIHEHFTSFVRHVEEPFAAAPTGVMYHLASLAAAHVKTVLSGEGADELFGGYEWLRVNSPYWVRPVCPKAPFRAASRMVNHPRVRRLFRILGAPDNPAADTEWRRCLTPEDGRFLLKPEYRTEGPGAMPIRLPDKLVAECRDGLQRKLALEFLRRLSDGIVMMGDKVSMAHSLEVRLPFLSQGVIASALRLPSDMKIRRGREKYVLSMLAKRYLPPEIAARKKQGVGYPGGIWKEDRVIQFARSLLLDSQPSGPFRQAAIERMLDLWLTPGRRNIRNVITVMCLQGWWNEFFGAR